MRFRSNNSFKTKAVKTFLPVIPLVRVQLPPDDKDKSKFITFELKVRASSGAGTPSYKKNVRTFEEGTPQEWLDVLISLREIWKQNAVEEPTDKAATIFAILKGESLTAFDTALEEARNPEDGEGDDLVEMIDEHIETALRVVTEHVFPFHALEIQRSWMQRQFTKTYDLSMKKTVAGLNRVNNYLPLFPGGTNESKFSETELIVLLETALPIHWSNHLDLKGFIPKDNDLKSLVDECERIERNEQAFKRERPDDDDNNKNYKKTKFGKSQTNQPKNGSSATDRVKGERFCKKCGTNPTHDTAKCFILKRLEREANSGEQGKPNQDQYSKRTLRKEVNAIARRAGRHDGLKIVESALKREQAKKAGRTSKKQDKKVKVAKKPVEEDTSSDESMHCIENRIPRKKGKTYKNVRFNSVGKVVAIEGDSDDDKKIPAKILKKKSSKKIIEVESSSDEEDPYKPTKEEKAFLRAIDKKEKKDQESESE
jgi:hypothetical protein